MIRKNIGKMVVVMLMLSLVIGCAGDIHKTESNTENVIETVRTTEQSKENLTTQEETTVQEETITSEKTTMQEETTTLKEITTPEETTVYEEITTSEETTTQEETTTPDRTSQKETAETEASGIMKLNYEKLERSGEGDKVSHSTADGTICLYIEDNIVVEWDGLKGKIDGGVLPNGFSYFSVSEGIDLDGDGMDERLLNYIIGARSNGVTVILDRSEDELLCIGKQSGPASECTAYRDFKLEIKIDGIEEIIQSDCSENGIGSFLKDVIWNEDGSFAQVDDEGVESVTVISGIAEFDYADIYKDGDELLICYNDWIFLYHATGSCIRVHSYYTLNDGEMHLKSREI